MCLQQPISTRLPGPYPSFRRKQPYPSALQEWNPVRLPVMATTVPSTTLDEDNKVQHVSHLEHGHTSDDEKKSLEDDPLTYFTPEEQKKIIHRLDRRLVVVVGVMYCVSLMDRTNLSNAAIAGMNVELNLGIEMRYVSSDQKISKEDTASEEVNVLTKLSLPSLSSPSSSSSHTSSSSRRPPSSPARSALASSSRACALLGALS